MDVGRSREPRLVADRGRGRGGGIKILGKHIKMIQRNIQKYKNEILIHSYISQGVYQNFINISYIYENNKPVQAKIKSLLYDRDIDIYFSEAENIIKTAILYAYNDINSIPIFEFDDDSHIDCTGKLMKPINLAFFYIVYYGKTWYEARFNAKMIDPEKYRNYKNSLSFLTDPSQKLEFIKFVRIIRFTLESVDIIYLLEPYYKTALTYQGFFENIPKSQRCELIHEWLSVFMDYYIGSTFCVKGWCIDANNMLEDNICDSLNYRIFSYKKMSNF